MFIIFKPSSLPACSNHLPFLFSILVYHPTLKMSPFLIAFVFQDVSASIQFNVQLWWQFGKMWNLNFYEMVKKEEKMVLSGLVFARKIARMILIHNLKGLMGPLMINMAFMPLYMWEMWDVTPVTDARTDSGKVEQYSVWAESANSSKKYNWC